MTVNFGGLPVRATFTLSSDADFFQVVKTSDGAHFPETTVMELRWLDDEDLVVATWTAAVDENLATFYEDKSDVAALLALNPVQGRLFYEDGVGGPELLLAKGTIHDLSP